MEKPELEGTDLTVEEISLEQQRFLEERTRQYKENGADPLEAIHQANEDWKKAEEMRTKETDEMWDQFSKKVDLAAIVEDQTRRALASYKRAYEKANNPLTLDFKLSYKSIRNEGGLVATVNLNLEICRSGVWKMWRTKEIKFAHVREMRDGYKWKLALQEAMLHDLLSWGITYCIKLDEARDAGVGK